MVLRNEAIVCLALTDTSAGPSWELLPKDASHLISFDERLEHCARYDSQANVAVWRTGENTAVARLANVGTAPGRLVMSPCGRYVAIQAGIPGAREQTSNLAVWDWSHETEAIWLPHRVAAGAIAFGSQGDQLVLGLENGAVVFYELPGCRELKQLVE